MTRKISQLITKKFSRFAVGVISTSNRLQLTVIYLVAVKFPANNYIIFYSFSNFYFFDFFNFILITWCQFNF